jgi:hypothetical protein
MHISGADGVMLVDVIGEGVGRYLCDWRDYYSTVQCTAVQ